MTKKVLTISLFFCLVSLATKVSPVSAQDVDLELQGISFNSPVKLVQYIELAHRGNISALPALANTWPVKRPVVRRHLSLVSSFDALFEKYGQQFKVSSSKLKSIAYCESHFNPAAVSRSGNYGGMYQYSASTWQATRKAMGLDQNPDLRFDAESAIMTSAFKIASGGLGAWPVCGQI